MTFTEDHSQFFRTADFACTGVYTPDGGSATTVFGIFDSLYSDDANVSSRLPVFECAASDVATMAQDDVLTVTGSTDDGDYYVRELEPDGTGLITLRLEKVIP